MRAIVFALLPFLFAACGRTPGTPGDDAEFGDTYTIALGPSPDSPDVPPVIEQDSLRLSVEYPGGCRDHDFSLRSRSSNDTLMLWLRHDANGDDCEALIFERLVFPAPSEAARAQTVVLLDPASEFPFDVARVDEEQGQ